MGVQILDGAIGTELISRGLELAAPEWSARAVWDAPDLLAEVHAEYAQAGATLHTANTFRTQPRALGPDWESALETAVRIARESVMPGQSVLGSMAPVEDCYRPDLSPGAATRAEHRALASALARAGCDRILCETFAHPAEALVAAEEAMATALPVWVSLTAGPFGQLLSPSALAEIARDLASSGVERVLLNCIAATRMDAYLDALGPLSAPIGVYANAGREEEALGWGSTGPRAAQAYADLAERWKNAGATVIGGCCGTGPAHIRAISERFA
jgi:S-methylmethionine-dependent homocysteine/selenocysteine methylase